LSRTERLIIDRISGTLRGEPSLLEDEQLLVGAAEYDPPLFTVAAKVSAERGERRVDLTIWALLTV